MSGPPNSRCWIQAAIARGGGRDDFSARDSTQQIRPLIHVKNLLIAMPQRFLESAVYAGAARTDSVAERHRPL